METVTTISMLGVGGDARLTFTEKHIRVGWGETTRRERRMISAVVAKARKAKFQVVTVDPDGKPDKPARWRDLPGLFGKESGEVLLQGPEKAIREIACDIVKEEIKEHNLVSVAQKDGTWKLIREPEVKEPAKGEKQEIEVKPPVGGG
jgi:hypothetical protein